MVAVDTDVIVRLLTRDEEEQFQKAMALNKILGQHPAHLLDSFFRQPPLIMSMAPHLRVFQYRGGLDTELCAALRFHPAADEMMTSRLEYSTW